MNSSAKQLEVMRASSEFRRQDKPRKLALPPLTASVVRSVWMINVPLFPVISAIDPLAFHLTARRFSVVGGFRLVEDASGLRLMIVPAFPTIRMSLFAGFVDAARRLCLVPESMLTSLSLSILRIRPPLPTRVRVEPRLSQASPLNRCGNVRVSTLSPSYRTRIEGNHAHSVTLVRRPSVRSER